jgi:adenylate cyclase
MAKGLSERERMKDAFGRFVNKEIAEMVLQGELKLGGERKDAAIFFSDLRGFTAMSEGMEPEEVVEYLNKYFTKMVGCVNDTHGIVDKFIGDAIMAHWGALQTHGNNTENAINAALMMRRGLIEFNADADDVKKPFAKFGCGINTGPVIAGQIGSEERLEFTVIGDAVNLASRIESLNKPFGTDILISHDSYEIVRDIYRVEKMPAIKVKGKSEAQTIYCVLGRFDDPNCIQSLDELRRQARIDYHGTDKKGEFLDEEKEVKYEIIEG